MTGPTRRGLLAGGALTAAWTAGARAQERVPLAATPISRMDTPWWRARHAEKLARLRQGRVDLVWYGDSITQNWERAGPPDYMDFSPAWQHFYGDRNAVNLGYKGDNTGHLLWRLQNGEAENISPRAAVLLIGANNFGHVHWSSDQTVVGIAAVVTEIRRRLPATKLLLLAILPSERSDYVTRATNRANRDLALRYGGGTDGVGYADVGSLLMRGGRVDRTQFYDPLLTPPEPVLHPTAQAQARLAAAIEPTLSAMLGDRTKASH